MVMNYDLSRNDSTATPVSTQLLMVIPTGANTAPIVQAIADILALSPDATTTTAGYLSASDKTKLNRINVSSITNFTVSGQTLTLHYVDGDGNNQTEDATLPSGGAGSNDGVVTDISYTPSTRTITLTRSGSLTTVSETLPLANGSNAGLMSRTQHSKLSNLDIRTVDTFEQTGGNLNLRFADGAGATQPRRVPLATTTNAGAMSPSDKTKLDATLDTEQIQDMLSTFIRAGTGLSLSYNDSVNTLTISLSGTPDTNTSFQRYLVVGTTNAAPTATEVKGGTGSTSSTLTVTGVTGRQYVKIWSARQLTTISNPVIGFSPGTNLITSNFNQSRLQVDSVNGYLYITTTTFPQLAINQEWTLT